MKKLIYLEDAIDETWKEPSYSDPINVLTEVRERIKVLPSVQPEIIMCKDCKFYSREDKRKFYRGSDCLDRRIYTIVPDRDFCSRAERMEK